MSSHDVFPTAWASGLGGAMQPPGPGAATSAHGLLSQRDFLDRLHQETEWVARSGDNALLLMLQPDLLAASPWDNEDRLIRLGQALCAQVRAQDHVGRIDHRVLGVLLHDCEAEAGLTVAQRLLGWVPTTSAPGQAPWTISIGAAFAPLWLRSEVSVWMARVLAQLRVAQSRGGHRLCVDSRYVSALRQPCATAHDVQAPTIEYVPSATSLPPDLQALRIQPSSGSSAGGKPYQGAPC